MAPPLASVPLPLMVKKLLLTAPVLFRMIPLAAPLAEMLRNVTPLAPMLVLVMLRAVLVAAVGVPMVLVPVTLTVLGLTALPLFALKTAAVPLSVIPPEKLNVVLVLVLRLYPCPLSLMLPPNETVPPV